MNFVLQISTYIFFKNIRLIIKCVYPPMLSLKSICDESNGDLPVWYIVSKFQHMQADCFLFF